MFTVQWVQSATNELADLWLDADSELREALTAATHVVDRSLRDNPNDQGESRPEDRRILLVPPMGVIFRVHADDRMVYVLKVWRFEQH